MILSLVMPQMGQLMTAGTIEQLFVSEASSIKSGSPLMDVRVDLSAAAPQDCPPIYSFRIVSRESGWIRQLNIAPGDTGEVGQVLALITSSMDESPNGVPVRPLRVIAANMLTDPVWMNPGTAPPQ